MPGAILPALIWAISVATSDWPGFYAATALELSGAGPTRIYAEWQPGRRSVSARVMIQILGVDAAFRQYGKSRSRDSLLIKNLPTGATVRVKILCRRGSLEAPDGPEAEITVP